MIIDAHLDRAGMYIVLKNGCKFPSFNIYGFTHMFQLQGASSLTPFDIFPDICFRPIENWQMISAGFHWIEWMVKWLARTGHYDTNQM